MALPSALLTMTPVAPLSFSTCPIPPRSASAIRTARAAHFSRSLSLCGNCSRVVGACAYAPIFMTSAITADGCGDGRGGGGGGGGGTAAGVSNAADVNELRYCNADCYWSSALDGRRGGARRRAGGAAARRSVGGGAGGGGRCGGDGADGGDGTWAGGGGDPAGPSRQLATESVAHAMYSHHFDIWEASYGAKTRT